MASKIEELRTWRQQSYENHLYSTAEMVGEQILALTGDKEDAYWLAQTFYAVGQYLRAAHLLKTRGNLDSSSKSRYLAARCLVAAQQLDEAQALIDSAGEDSSEEVGGILTSSLFKYLLGQIYTLRNNQALARDAYILALRLDPRCVEALDQLTTHEMLAPAAEWSLLKSLDLRGKLGANADLVWSMYSLRLTRTSQPSRLEAAVEVLTTNYGVDATNSAPIVLAEADSLYVQCQFSQCKQLCERYLDNDSESGGDPYFLRLYVNYIAALYELNEAALLYRVAYNLAAWASESPIAWYGVGTYYLLVGKLSEARRYFSKASIMDPGLAPAWLGFAHTFAQEGEHEQAIAAYTSTVKLFPGSHLPFLCLGMQQSLLNNPGLAEQYLSCSQGIFDEDPLVLNELGVVYYHTGDLIKAQHQLEQADALAKRLNCEPHKFVCVRANLGFVYRKTGQYKRALSCFEEVLASAPLDANILAAIGFVHLQLGDPFAAITRLDQALGISREDPVSRDLLERAIEAANARSKPLLTSSFLNTTSAEAVDIDVDLVQ